MIQKSLIEMPGIVGNCLMIGFYFVIFKIIDDGVY